MAENTIARDVIKMFESLRSKRGTFDEHCREVAERVVPTAKDEFDGSKAGRSQGEIKTEYMYDSTAAIGLGRFASIMDSLLTPRNSKWHKLQVTNEELGKDRAVKLWFDEVANILFKYRYSPKANFASQNFMIFESVGAFGNGPMFIDELDSEPGLRYKACSLGGIYITENHQGLVDGVIRHFKLTARQAAQKWPDTLPEKILKQANESGAASEVEFEFLHCVKSRKDADISRLDFKGMPWVSYYVAKAGAALLSESGYRSFPYAVSRHKQAAGELYARSPAMEVLPSIKTLNEQKRTVLKQGHRITDPVLLSYDDDLAARFSLRPGSINSGGVTRDGKALVQALPTGSLAAGVEMMEMEKNDIKDIFLVTLFQILVESPGTQTATEVLERVKEKGILLAPAFGRQEAEYLGPMIERELDLLMDQGLVPEMPPVLVEAQGEYTIIYDSPFSRAQRAEEATGLMRVLEWAMGVANATQDPSIMDNFNFNEIVPEMSAIHGIPEKWMQDENVVQAMREQRAAEQERQMKAQEAAGQAALIKSAAVAKEKAPEEFDELKGQLQQEQQAG